MKKRFIALCAGTLLLGAVAGIAQTTQTPPAPQTADNKPAYIRPETAEQRKARLGSADDPGLDPSPLKQYWRFGRVYHIDKVLRRFAAFDQPEGFVRPYAGSPAVAEIYQVDPTYVWFWVADSDPTPPAEAPADASDKLSASMYDFLTKARHEFAPLQPPPSGKRIRFRESSDGLPTDGSWRDSLAVADVNEDGCPDLITPPQRKGNGIPVIFLGDCKGHWTYWAQAKFSRAIDYGGVAAADFNKDGHVDLVFAVHLQGLVVFLGDGKGNFKESSAGLPNDFPTRRVVVADVDHDGYPDVVAISEGPSMLTPRAAAPLRAWLNRKKGTKWESVSIASDKATLGGDYLTVGNFNRDRYPDFIASSVLWGSMDIAFLSTGAAKWRQLPSDGHVLPALAYYFASTAGKFSSRDHDDAIITTVRYWPAEANPARVATPQLFEMTTIDRLSFTKDGARREAIVRLPGHGGVVGLDAGDFDGDKNLDLAYLAENPRTLGLLLGDGHGGFRTAQTDGVTIDDNHRIYDLKVADVNKDGRPDIIVMYESEGVRVMTNRGGSIHVFLNMGVDAAPPPAQTAATPAH